MDVGPALEWLTRRLAECPPEFSRPPGSGKGTLDIEAIVGDLLRDLGLAVVTQEDTAPFAASRFPKASQGLLMVTCWLLHDDAFTSQRRFARPVRAFLSEGLTELAKVVRAEQFIRDPDRREELVRLALRALDLVPAGETETAALDRLTTLSSVERKRVLDATKAARDHAERVRKAMAEQAALESAARYGRE
jgi:hypothetical protein